MRCNRLLMDKVGLRTIIRKRKAEYTDEQLVALSECPIKMLMDDTLLKKAKVVCLYHSLPDEVCTHYLIEELSRSKIVLLPSIVNGVIELHKYSAQSGLNEGLYGIKESQGKVFSDLDKIDLVVVPGMAFDRLGNRLGRGKGYYDKFLSKVKAYKIGLCFPFQLVDQVPHDEHDISVDKVIAS